MMPLRNTSETPSFEGKVVPESSKELIFDILILKKT